MATCKQKIKCAAIGLFVLFVSLSQLVDGLAVISIDFGGEFMKIAIVKPGVPMEVVLNRESKRKTPTVLSIKDGEREIGESAIPVIAKSPKQAYWFLLSVLGKKLDNPHVKQFQQRFPYYDLKEDPQTGTVVFQQDESTIYAPEELIAMILENAKHLAETFAEQKIQDAVITVPVYFNQAERRAMLRAGELVGLNVLQLMNDNSAVALNYGVFRRKEFNATKQHYMFVDMGSTSMSATIVSYQVVKMKDRGFAENNPQVTVLGVGFDQTLGGVEWQLRLRDHLAKLFNEQKKTKNDVTKNARAMAKLFKEAGRVMKVLSANADHYAQVESLLDDKDFKAKVTRAEFEEMTSDLFGRIKKPIEDALKMSHMTWIEIKEVILMGGVTRMPKVRDILIETTGKTELGKSINTDEAAVMGAVYQAAYLSKGFKVLRFGVKDGNIFPIQVEFERTKVDESGKESTKLVKRTLFGTMNPFPQKKVMTFNKHTKDFSFEVNYGDLTFLDEEARKMLGALNLKKVSLTGVADAHDTHGATTEAKGVKAHFRMDESGLLHLDKVESVFEKAPSAEDTKEESTLSKLGSTISNFFSGGKKDEDEKVTVDEKEDKKEEETKDKETTKKDDAKKTDETKDADKEKKEETKEGKKEQKPDEKKEEKKDEKKDEKKTESTDDKNKTESTKNDTTEKKEPEKPKPVILREDIKVESQIVDITDPSAERTTAFKTRIAEMKKHDDERRLLEKVKNELESYIFDTKDKLYQPQYEKCSTEDERTKLFELLNTASDWQYETEDDTPAKAYEDKLKELKEATKDVFYRVKELDGRPKAVEALRSMLNQSEFFLTSIRNLTKDEPIFTEVEVNVLSKLINDTWEWLNKTSKEQKATSITKNPVLRVEDIAIKYTALDREIKYLVNKAKIYKPKPKPDEKTTTTKNDNSTAGGDNTDNKTTSTEEEAKKKPEDAKTDSDKTTDEKPKYRKPKQKRETEETKKEEPSEPLQLDKSETSSTDKESTKTDEPTETPATEAPTTEAPGTEKPETVTHDAGDL